MSRALFIFQALTFFLAVVAALGTSSVESNQHECSDGITLVGAQSFYSQFPTNSAEETSCRSRIEMVEFNPTHETREGIDVVWQIPANPKGILYLVHSACGTPFSYWPSHPNAPQCIGTPEHLVVTKQALERGFAVIATKSVTDEWETWPPASALDIQKFKKILKAWTAENGLQGLPLSAWGTSNGGDYVSCLPYEVEVHSLVVMISHGRREAFESAVAGKYPPTLFVPMIKDEKTFELVKENVEILRGKGIPSDLEAVPPLTVDPHFFAENIDELDVEQSAKLHSLLVEGGVLGEDHSVKKVLMQNAVEPYLKKAGILPTGEDFHPQQDEEKLTGQSESGGGGGRGLPPSARGEAPPTGGRGGGRGPPSQRGEAPPGRGRGGRGPKVGGGGPPPSHPLAEGVSNQLMVAEGRHTLTAHHNTKVFSWLKGEGWPQAQSQ